jgi:hypothetical protein
VGASRTVLDGAPVLGAYCASPGEAHSDRSRVCGTTEAGRLLRLGADISAAADKRPRFGGDFCDSKAEGDFTKLR